MRLGEFIKLGYAAGVSQLPKLFKTFQSDVNADIAALQADFTALEESISSISGIKTANQSLTATSWDDAIDKVNLAAQYLWGQASGIGNTVITVDAGRFTSTKWIHMVGGNTNVTLKGQDPVTHNMTAAMTKGGSAGAWTYTGTFTTAGDASLFAVNDYVALGYDGANSNGPWKVTAVNTGTNSITITAAIFTDFASATGPTSLIRFPTQIDMGGNWMELSANSYLTVRHLAITNGAWLVEDNATLNIGSCILNYDDDPAIMGDNANIIVESVLYIRAVYAFELDNHSFLHFKSGSVYFFGRQNYSCLALMYKHCRIIATTAALLQYILHSAGDSGAGLIQHGGYGCSFDLGLYDLRVVAGKVFTDYTTVTNNSSFRGYLTNPTLANGAALGYTANTANAYGSIVYHYT